jgi:hypothetical protein
VPAREPAARVEEHAGHVVTGEDRVDLDGAGRRDDPLRVHPQELVPTDHGDERPVVDAHRGVVLQDRRARERAELLGELPDPVERRSRRDLLAERALVAHDHGVAALGGRHPGCETGDPAAHYQGRLGNRQVGLL